MTAIGTASAPLIGDDPSGLGELGRQLEEIRCKAGMSQAELGQLLGFSQSTVSRVLDGKYRHMSQQMRRTAEWVIAMAHGGHSMATAPYLTLEQSATVLCTWEPAAFPGLLQTPEYARHVLRAATPGIPAADLDQAVALRGKRQEIWERPDPLPPMFAAVIGEAALRRLVGTPEIMRGQMEHLVAMSEHPRVRLQVLPFDAGGSVGLLAPFVVAAFASADQPDAVFLDDTLTGRTTDDRLTVAKLRLLFDELSREALRPRDSIKMITEAAGQWTT